MAGQGKDGSVSPRILLVDDSADFRDIVDVFLQSKGVEVVTASTARKGEEAFSNTKPELVLLDVVLPDGSGVDLVSHIKGLSPSTPVLMVSATGETETIVNAIKAGASDYIQKSNDLEGLWLKIAELLQMQTIKSTEEELKGRNEYGAIIGKGPKARQLIQVISKVAHVDAPVFIRGESGTGKGLVAELIHSLSPRKKKPFVTINCPAIPENLLESELFGHEKGAFTGAIREKTGKFEYADGGTVFLDEIGDLSPELQAKILRVLQGHEFERVGGLKTLMADVRVIAATNRNIEKSIQEGHFREDLYYRLNVLPILIPPLRERKEDIPLLVNHFLAYFNRKNTKKFREISPEILADLTDYDWPGNIRELQSVIERAVVLGREPRLLRSDFSLNRPVPTRLAGTNPLASLRDLEYQALVRALEQTNGNIAKASRLLGIGRDTVYRHLKIHNIALKRSRSDLR